MLPRMNTGVLRPLRVGEILDAGIRVYLRNARTMIALTALVIVPLTVIQVIVELSSLSNANEVPGTTAFKFGATNTSATTTANLNAQAGANFLVVGISLISGLLVTAVCVRAASESYLGSPAGIGESFSFVFRRFFRIASVELLAWIGIGLAAICLLLPGIYLYVAWSVALPVLLVEQPRPTKSLRRSRELVKGRWWQVFGVLLLATLMAAIVSFAFTGVLVGVIGAGSTLLGAVLLSNLSSAIVALLVRPFQAAVTTVLYYDLRIRREGFDIAVLAQQLGMPELSTQPPPAAREDFGPESVGTPGGPPFWPPPASWVPPIAPEPSAPASTTPTWSRDQWGPDSVGTPGGPPYWPPPPGWVPGESGE